ncbi:MAG: hypothetical protein GY716_03760 [bacterium]|nr:hypothetical protein [bacterium]
MPGTSATLPGGIPWVTGSLAAAVLITVLVVSIAGRRGGRFRGLPGWSGWWVAFAVELVLLSQAPRYVSFPLLGISMFAALRAYFFVAPLRASDRYAILAAYLAIPIALVPAYSGSDATFLATVPVALFLGLPLFVSMAPQSPGTLDSLGRTLLGALLFVFCLAHVGLLAGPAHRGVLELFGILVLASEVPQRLAGRLRSADGGVGPAVAVVASLLLAGALGYWLGPSCGLVEEDGARAGILVAVAVTFGGIVSNAVAADLSLTTSSSMFGRGAFLNRAVPAVYAAPVYFHYLNHFA